MAFVISITILTNLTPDQLVVAFSDTSLPPQPLVAILFPDIFSIRTLITIGLT